MRSLIPATVVLSALFVVAPGAHGQAVAPPSDFTAFSVAFMYENGESTPQAQPLIFVSESDGATQFRIPGLDALEAVSGGSFGVNASYGLILGIAPRPGYVVTSYELSGTLTAEMLVGVPPPGSFNWRYGFAENNSEFGIARPYPGNLQITDLHGIQDFAFSSPGYPVSAGFPVAEIEVWGFIHANGGYTHYDYYDEAGDLETWKTPPTSNVAVSDTLFTVHWQIVPVPEPASWAMLLAGLLLFPATTAIRARRGRHAHPSTFLP